MSSDHFAPDEQSMAAASVADPGPSGFARLFTVITSPRLTFEAMARKPQPWVGLVAFIIIVGVGAALTSHITGPEQMEAAIDGPFGANLADDEEYLQKIEDAKTPSMADRVQGGLLGGAFAAVFTAIVALIYWVACLAFGGRKGFKPTLDVILLAAWIGGIGQLLTQFLILSKGTSIGVGLSLAPLLGDMDPTSTPYVAVNIFTNVFSIWQLVLIAMGLAIVHGMSTSKGWLAALIPWLFVSMVAVGLQSAFT